MCKDWRAGAGESGGGCRRAASSHTGAPGETVVDVGPQVADLDVEKHRGLPTVLQHAFQRLGQEKPVATSGTAKRVKPSCRFLRLFVVVPARNQESETEV